ncbi:MAG: hypothetical protein V4531_13590 [Actinomycetota bacterium]
MSPRARLVLAGILTLLLLGGASAYGVVEIAAYRSRLAAPSQVRTTGTAPDTANQARIVFRNTATGAGYGRVASVPIARPGGTRTVTDLTCDRVYETVSRTMCLRIDRGIVTTFSATLLDKAGVVQRSWGLPGIPSRTRIAPDSSLVAFTSFVTGTSYATVGFSTATFIASVDGRDYGNLESFALTVEGRPVTSLDRNFWGVTFTADDNIFYATAASGGRTWLVRGDLAARTLTSLRQGAECPSISPDGSRIAYKKNVSTSAIAYWSIAVLNLKTGEEAVLPEKRNVDDQVLWLDDSTILYGLPTADQPGDSDIWAIPSDGSTGARPFIEHAWSPSVVRP